MKRVAGFALLIFSSFISFGCEKAVFQEQTINNIVAVYWHEHNRYSFAVENEDGSISMRSFGDYTCGGNETKIFTDVTDKNKMWAKGEKAIGPGDGGNCGSSSFKNLEIHIHTIKELNGAGWNHGKFGRGTTTVIGH